MHTKSGFLAVVLFFCVAFSLDSPREISINLIGIMVEFQIDDDPLTSGDGKFLSNEYNNYIESIDGTFNRCDGFIVDRPPHGNDYFLSQMEAVSNYYKSTSNNNISISYDLIESDNDNGYYTLPNTMKVYAKSDSGIVALFNTAVDMARSDIEDYVSFSEEITNPVIVVFHAGISQDFSMPFIDPTIYDIKSAYIDNEMYADSGIEDNSLVISGTEYTIESGILLPETQNHIFYDVVEDIWSMSDYCDIQLGLTGTFALQVSYALDLPILFNSIDSKPTIGIFGLTDYGYNNGRGISPSIINPWTRTSRSLANYWSEIQQVFPMPNSNYEYSIPARDSIDVVYRVDINDTEYFLLENRNNWIIDDDSIDSLRIKNKIFDNDINDFKRGHWFDNLVYRSDAGLINFSSDSVIVSLENYDIGLPGSGILIWHVKEPQDKLDVSGVNNIENFVEIEESDGSIDIGYQNYAFFSSNDPTNGTSWDMWYSGNDAYSYANLNSDEVIFSSLSMPNSNTKADIGTGISIKINSNPSRNMDIEIVSSPNYNIDSLSFADIDVLGNSVIDGVGNIFYRNNGAIYRQNSISNSLIDIEDPETCYRVFYNLYDDLFVCSESEESYITNNGDLIFGTMEPLGYLEDSDVLSTVASEIHDYIDNYEYSLGDIDLDGLDEVVFVDSQGSIRAMNNDGVSLSNFPIYGTYKGTPLIANIVGDKYPEIIVRCDVSIDIIGSDGALLHRLIDHSEDDEIFFVPYWEDNTIALRNGGVLYIFDQDLDYSYWLNNRGQSTNYASVSGIHQKDSNNIKNINPYFYPNPVSSSLGKFRFYNTDHTDGSIKIYSSSGFLIETIELSDLKPGTHNEFPLDISGYNTGIYFADFLLGDNERLIKIMVLK